MVALEDESYRLGEGIDRVLALSDGVFAFAITLLSLDLVLPTILGTGTNASLASALAGEYGSFFNFALSFFVVGVYWASHRRMFSYIRATNLRMVWLNLGFLFFIVLIPFGTRILDQFGTIGLATAVYAVINVGASGMSALTWEYAVRKRRFVSPRVTGNTVKWLRRRGLLTSAVFAISIPLSFVSTVLAIASWVLMLAMINVAVRFSRSNEEQEEDVNGA